jgi:hypothetical protein
MKYAAGVIALSFLFSLSAILQAAAAYEYCANSTFRVWDESFVFDGTLIPLSGNETCQYGCEGGECTPTRSGDSTAFAIMFSIFAFSFIYLGINIKSEEHAILSWLFIPIGILFMFIGVMSVVAINIYQEGISNLLIYTGYGIFIIMSFLVFYFLITILTNLFKTTRPYGESDSRGKK